MAGGLGVVYGGGVRGANLLLLLGLVACSPKDDSDTVGVGDTDSSTLADDTAGANLPPSAAQVAISPARALDGDDLLVTVLTPAVDPEGSSVVYRYSWQVEGVDRPELTDPTVGADETVEGETWQVSVYASDGLGEGPPGTASVTVGNQPPQAPVIHLEPAEPTPDDSIRLVVDTPASDPEGDPVTTTIRWYENGLYGASRDGLTEITAVYVDGGDTFRVVVEVTDGLSTPVTVEASVTVANQPPVLSVTVSPSPIVQDSESLTATVRASDPDGGSEVSLRYVWYRDGVEATDVGDSHEVADWYTAPLEEWTLTVFGSDGHDEVSASLAEPVLVIPWLGRGTRQHFTATLAPDGAGGYVTTTGEWAVDFALYSLYIDSESCSLRWDVEAVEEPSYCEDCEYSFEANFLFDTTSTVVSGCSYALTDGVGFFTFNNALTAFDAYNAGPALDGHLTGFGLDVTGTGYRYDSYARTTETYSATAVEDTAGNVSLDIYSYMVQLDP